MNEMKSILQYDHFLNFLQVKIKGVIPPWMKWNLSFNNDYFLKFLQVKISLSEKWCDKYSTLGLPFIKGPSPHEWNEYHPSTKTTV